ncbi:aminotransferase class V-fold PLP-dependent enzyme [Granulosicoccus antarcticus]|uniref:Cysteine desulfurase IscS n=1 Tax=Granulosicoccus antarcticus IMCC3135 TaxID=1192854 RepID=A0A2Z2NY48_9GAMM|nr:aminotransferase class V-fold PLP-dependent enzyme [Granulosicoccus antarcticus]ASJ76376.1 Cysteine desulfurase IscS [Granulosicoccus antarcticus IMCC3135]
MSIYLNSASHGLPSKATVERMVSHLQLELASGTTHAAKSAQEEVENVRLLAATLIGAEPDDIGFTSTTTSAWLPLATLASTKGKRILVAPHEWGDNIRLLQSLAAQTDCTVEVLPELDLEAPNLDEWQACLDEDVAALYAPMVTSVHGLRYPIEAIGRLPRPTGCLFIVDAAQALGQIPVDVTQLGCDALVSTCRKWLRGPKATALFWTAPSLPSSFRINQLQPVDASITLQLGLGSALREALDTGIPQRQQDITRLTAHAHQQACHMQLENITVHPIPSGTLAIEFPVSYTQRVQKGLLEADMIAKLPDRQHCEPFSPGFNNDTQMLRVSPNVYNTAEEITLFMHCLKGLLSP